MESMVIVSPLTLPSIFTLWPACSTALSLEDASMLYTFPSLTNTAGAPLLMQAFAQASLPSMAGFSAQFLSTMYPLMDAAMADDAKSIEATNSVLIPGHLPLMLKPFEYTEVGGRLQPHSSLFYFVFTSSGNCLCSSCSFGRSL